MENIQENMGNINGFRVGEYFVTFPPGDFIKEDKDGKLYALVDIFKIDSNNKAVKLNQKSISKELEDQINEEINKFLYAAMNAEQPNINK